MQCIDNSFLLFFHRMASSANIMPQLSFVNASQSRQSGSCDDFIITIQNGLNIHLIFKNVLTIKNFRIFSFISFCAFDIKIHTILNIFCKIGKVACKCNHPAWQQFAAGAESIFCFRCRNNNLFHIKTLFQIDFLYFSIQNPKYHHLVFH